MTKLADLHIHTNFSDSTSPPEEVVEQAIAAGLSCIAISDHDTTAGVQPTMDIANKVGLEVISGVELSTEVKGRDVHILGYCFDHTNEKFNSKLNEMQDSRIARMERMIEKLKEIGINDITLEEVCGLAESKSVGRPHLALKLVEKGHVKDIRDAFNKYLADGKLACVAKHKMTPHEGIKLIKDAGGVAVLAHPMVTRVDEYIEDFAQSGLGGIEVYYPTHAKKIVHRYEQIAVKHGLCVTGGSDAHGDAKKHTYVGKIKVPYRLVEHLKQLASTQNV
jgi:predicted metal-dependent phosphoesterase TrpH